MYNVVVVLPAGVMTVHIVDLVPVYNFCVINMYIILIHTVGMHIFLFDVFLMIFLNCMLKYSNHQQVYTSHGNTKTERPYILYQQVLLFVKI